VQNQTSTHYVVDTYNNLYLLLNLIVKILSHYNNYLMGIVTSRQLITLNKLKIIGSSSNLHGGNPALFMSGPAFQYFALLPTPLADARERWIVFCKTKVCEYF
jgi:hypothetical protein